jgi:hypothetical protein
MLEVQSVPEFQSTLDELINGHGDNVVAVLGYGSNFLGHNVDDKSIWDTIIVVKDTKRFHILNTFRRKQDHFSQDVGFHEWLNSFGMNYYQSEGPDKIKFKYGVVSLKNLEKDCESYSFGMYIAGRLQKPIKPIYLSDQNKTENVAEVQKLEKAIARNRERAAVQAIYILDPNKEFTFDDFLVSVVSLSYHSDLRLEDPNKIKNIVEKNKEQLAAIYRPIFERLLSENNNPIGAFDDNNQQFIGNHNADNQEKNLQLGIRVKIGSDDVRI